MTIRCNKCGQRVEQIHELGYHKCKWFNRLLYEKDITIPQLVVFAIGINLITENVKPYWFMLVICFVFGMLIGWTQYRIDKRLTK